MNLSAGKFFKNLFQSKQRPNVKSPKKAADVVKHDGYGIMDSLIPEKKVSRNYVSAHNMEQKGKAQVVKKSRKANKLARKQRKINGRKS